MDSTWVEDIRDQCLSAGVAVLLQAVGRPHTEGRRSELDGRTWDEMPRASAVWGKLITYLEGYWFRPTLVGRGDSAGDLHRFERLHLQLTAMVRRLRYHILADHLNRHCSAREVVRQFVLQGPVSSSSAKSTSCPANRSSNR